MTIKRTWKPVTAGILEIIEGSLSVLVFIGLIIAYFIVADNITVLDLTNIPRAWVTPTVLISLAIPSLILGVLEIIGGIYALITRKWGLALTGAIATIISNLLLGIPAVILIALAKDEFKWSITFSRLDNQVDPEAFPEQVSILSKDKTPDASPL
jgi:Ca2+/H+ antiporter